MSRYQRKPTSLNPSSIAWNPNCHSNSNKQRWRYGGVAWDPRRRQLICQHTHSVDRFGVYISMRRFRRYHERLRGEEYRLEIGRLAGSPPWFSLNRFSRLTLRSGAFRGSSFWRPIESRSSPLLTLWASRSSARPLSSSRSELVKVLRRWLSRVVYFPSRYSKI